MHDAGVAGVMLPFREMKVARISEDAWHGDGEMAGWRIVSERRAAEHGAFLRSFGQALRKCRQDRGWTQEELADRSGLHRTFVGMMERGDSGFSLDRLVDLARAFDVEPASLIPRWADVAADSARVGATDVTRHLVPAGGAVTGEELAAVDAEWRDIVRTQTPVTVREDRQQGGKEIRPDE